MKDKDLLKRLEIFEVPKSDIYALRNQFYVLDGFPTKSIRQSHIDFCIKLLDKMVHNGATEEELERVLLFSYVVYYSIESKLSLLKAEDYYNIQELRRKYL